MFNSKKLFAAVLALALAYGPASAQLATTHAGTVGGPTGTPVSNACSTSSGTTITFTAQGIGNAKSNRISVVTINWSDSAAAGTAELTGVTIGGTAMFRAVRATLGVASSNSEIWYVANPTGTTADIVATFSTAVDGVTIEVYSLVGYNTVIATTTGTTSVSQAYDNKQLAIATGSRTVNVSTSLSNMTNDFSSACGSSLWGVHASQALRGNSGTLTSAINPTSNSPKIALAKWSVSTFVASCSASTNFLARTSGQDNTHKLAYDTLICGLVTDGILAKLDFLHEYAAADSATAVLNLVSNNYNGVTHGSPTFTVNTGFTGVDSSATVYIDTGFNPGSAVSPQYVQDSAHMSVWSASNVVGSVAIGSGDVTGVVWQTGVAPKLTSDSLFYARVNSNFSYPTGATNSSALGFFLANRSSSTAIQGYRNGIDYFDRTNTSGAPQNRNLYSLGFNNGGTPLGSANQLSSASAGSSLTSADAANFYVRQCTYLFALGTSGGCAPPSSCTEATNFLARTSSIDVAHTNAYKNLICGLVTDGIWTKLDVLHVYAAQDSTTALLNLVSSSFNGTANGSPTFTANQGYTGVNGSSTVYINTNFNPATAPSPKYVQNSGHLSVWGATDTGLGSNHAIGMSNGGTNNSIVSPRFSDGKSYFAINAPYLSVTNASPQGFFVASRGGANDLQGYKNAVSTLSSSSNASLTVASFNFYTLANNFNGTPGGTNSLVSMASIGSNLSSGDVTLFYNRLRTYMTAVGVP